MRKVIAVVLLFATMSVALGEVDYRWFSMSGMNGTLIAGVENGNGSYLRIYCTTGLRGGPSFEYQPKKTRLASHESVQVVVGDETSFFDLDVTARDNSGFAPIETRGSRLQLEKLVRDIIATKLSRLVVEVPRVATSETFSLKDARKALQFDKDTLVDPCEGSS